ncbi:MAG TPA: hypothetical protein P5186_21740 [Candidatus Paceibacterota bacterium]|nr:hypothetical protein [Candidatus Paceibacterota bacterium]
MMRTKTLILTAVLGAASVAAAVAQSVYSVNAVGFVNKTVKAGQFALLANPLNLPDNTLAAVLPDVPVNTKVYEYDAATGAFSIYTKRATGWTGTGAATAKLNPGEAFFIQNVGTADFNVTFVGEVPQGTLTTPIAQGFSLIASQVPQAGTIQTQLGLPAQTNDKAYLFVDGNYQIFTRRASSWTGGTGEPAVGVADGFFYQAVAAGTWTRSFSVNQ